MSSMNQCDTSLSEADSLYWGLCSSAPSLLYITLVGSLFTQHSY